MATDKSHKFIP